MGNGTGWWGRRGWGGAFSMWISELLPGSSKAKAFELWCWRRLLRVPWTARRSNQSILKEISPEYSLERLMLKLKPQNFGHLMQRTDSLKKTLMLGKTEGANRMQKDAPEGPLQISFEFKTGREKCLSRSQK